MMSELNKIEDARRLKGLLSEIKILKKQIFGETHDLITFCMSCGEYLGQFVLAEHTMAEIRSRPLCEKCFNEKVGKIAQPKFLLP